MCTFHIFMLCSTVKYTHFNATSSLHQICWVIWFFSFWLKRLVDLINKYSRSTTHQFPLDVGRWEPERSSTSDLQVSAFSPNQRIGSELGFEVVEIHFLQFRHRHLGGVSLSRSGAGRQSNAFIKTCVWDSRSRGLLIRFETSHLYRVLALVGFKNKRTVSQHESNLRQRRGLCWRWECRSAGRNI